MYTSETGRSRFGELAVDLGYLHRDQLQQVLVVQRELAEVGVDISIEVILLQLCYMTNAEAEEVWKAANMPV